jgi:hypothetical protein
MNGDPSPGSHFVRVSPKDKSIEIVLNEVGGFAPESKSHVSAENRGVPLVTQKAGDDLGKLFNRVGIILLDLFVLHLSIRPIHTFILWAVKTEKHKTLFLEISVRVE